MTIILSTVEIVSFVCTAAVVVLCVKFPYRFFLVYVGVGTLLFLIATGYYIGLFVALFFSHLPLMEFLWRAVLECVILCGWFIPSYLGRTPRYGR